MYGSGTPIDGTGQKIVVVGQSNIVLADIAAFGQPLGCLRMFPRWSAFPPPPTGVQNGGDEQESSLDIEWSGAAAKRANIIFVYSGNGVFDAMQYAITQNLAPVITISYGACEQFFQPSDIAGFGHG